MKKLNKETLLNRRAFLRRSIVGRLIPAVTVYLVAKSTPPLFGQSSGRQEPI